MSMKGLLSCKLLMAYRIIWVKNVSALPTTHLQSWFTFTLQSRLQWPALITSAPWHATSAVADISDQLTPQRLPLTASWLTHISICCFVWGLESNWRFGSLAEILLSIQVAWPTGFMSNLWSTWLAVGPRTVFFANSTRESLSHSSKEPVHVGSPNEVLEGCV